MGLFSFIKDAGASLFGGSRSVETKEVSAEDKVRALKQELDKYNLPVQNLSLRLEGDKVTVKGLTETQEIREKAVLVLGNVAGIARVDDQLEVAEAPKPQARFYEVKKGDSLSKIAKEMYGDMMKYPVIFEANKPMLKDPDKIYPGQMLRIPPLEG